MFSTPADKSLRLPPRKWSTSSLAREGLGYLDRTWGVVPSGRSYQPFQFNTSCTRDPIVGDPDKATKQNSQVGSAGVLPSVREQLGNIPELEADRRPNQSPLFQSQNHLTDNSGLYHTRSQESVADGSYVDLTSQPAKVASEERRSFSPENGALAGARDMNEQEDDSPDRQPRNGSHISNTLSMSSHSAHSFVPASPPSPTSAFRSQIPVTGQQIVERTAETAAELAASLAPDPNTTVSPTSQAQPEPRRTKPHHKTEVENRLAGRVHADGQLADRPCERCQRTGKQCVVRPQVSSRCATCVAAKAKCIR